MKRNPRFRMHPDLFGGETPIFVRFEDLSREEQLELKRSNLTPEEIMSIKRDDEELYSAIVENSPEEQKLAVEKCNSEIKIAVDYATALAGLSKDFADVIRKSREFDGLEEKFSLDSLRNPSNWHLRAVDIDSSEEADYEVEFYTVIITVDLSEFSLTEWEIEDVSYEVQRKNPNVDEIEENQEKLRLYITAKRKALAYFKLNEKSAEYIARCLSVSTT